MLSYIGFYVVFLKDEKNCDLIYGRQRYDYQKGSVVCLAPGQVIGIEDTGEIFQPQGYALCFHPDLIRGTNLGRAMSEYTFFSYEVNEALHLSEQERHTFIDCLIKIQEELQHSIDRMSKRLIANHIELLLNYCLRFYERQFITRQQLAPSEARRRLSKLKYPPFLIILPPQIKSYKFLSLPFRIPVKFNSKAPATGKTPLSSFRPTDEA